MNCTRCEKQSDCALKHLGQLCKDCFCDLIERRARKELRQKCPLKPGDTVAIISSNGLEAVVVDDIVQRVAKDIPCEVLLLEKGQRAPVHLRCIRSSSATRIAADLLGEVLGQHQDQSSQGEIVVFESLTEEEMSFFAKFKGLSYEERDLTEIDQMLKHISEKYENSIFGLVKSKHVLDKVSTSQSRDIQRQ